MNSEVNIPGEKWIGDEASETRKLAQILIEAREKLGLDRNEAARQAHMPVGYIEMLEGEGTRRVADPIYLVPFLRRYAAVLGLDGEELAMRFVRELQRLESEAARTPETLLLAEKHRSNWIAWVAAAVVAIIAITLGRLGRSYYREQASPASSSSTLPTPVEPVIPYSTQPQAAVSSPSTLSQPGPAVAPPNTMSAPTAANTPSSQTPSASSSTNAPSAANAGVKKATASHSAQATHASSSRSSRTRQPSESEEDTSDTE